jgi:two-component system invasion response regulator UvrY
LTVGRSGPLEPRPWMQQNGDGTSAMQTTVRVLVADDHAVVREGLKKILADAVGMEVVAEAADGVAVLERLRGGGVDVVVLDLSMPGITGIEVIEHMRREYPSVHVLVLSVHPEDRYAIRVMRAGASGYLMKESAPDELVAALRRVSEGHKYVSSSLAEKLAIGLVRGADREPHETLSDREYEVLRRLASGQTVGQIADELALSAKTVSTYRSRLMRKMRMHSNAELVRYAMAHKLID